MTTLCLTMIVKDEAAVIRRCLRSVRPHISAWCIADTGSRDETAAIIERELSGIPGKLRRDKWQDFSTNRNLALEGARSFGCDYLLTLDADEELQPLPEGAKFDGLDADGYNAWFHLKTTDHTWQRKLLMKSTHPWRYVGAIHEYPKGDNPHIEMLGDVHVMSHHDGARNQAGEVQKYARDAKLLKRELRKDPKNARHWFYYARSLGCSHQWDKAIAAYRKRVALGDCDNSEEVFQALYQIAAIREIRGDHWRDVAQAYQAAFNARSWRAEPLWALAVLHNDAGEHAIAELYARKAAQLPVPPDALMVDMSIYAWRAADELAGTLAKLGRLDESKAVLEKLHALPQLPEAERARVSQNIEMIRAA